MKAGFKQQWSGFDDAPRSVFVGAYGRLRKEEQHYFDPKAYSLRISDPSQYGLSESSYETERKHRHGVGGFLISDTQGAFEQISGYLNYAFHLPVGNTGYLSFGASLGMTNYEVDLSKIRLRDMDNDAVYNSLLSEGSSNTFFNVNAGLSYYTPDYYVSYALVTAANTLVSGNENVLQDREAKHQVMLGYQWDLNNNLTFQPSAFLRLGENLPEEWMVSMKFRFKDMIWAGAGYRNDGDIVGLLGLTINNFIQFGYAYDLTTSQINDFNNGSHEVVLGLLLFNDNRSKTYFW